MGVNLAQAEILGLFVGDGCLQKNYVCFWGNPVEDREYYDQHLPNLFKAAFGIEINPHLKASNSVYGFYVCKPWFLEFFKSVGFLPGSKTYSVRVPDCIKSGSKFMKAAFVRGFLSADGCLNFDRKRGKYIVFKRKFHVFPRIVLRSVCQNLMLDIKELLFELGIKSSIQSTNPKNPGWKTSYGLWVTGERNLKDWFNKIGFSNAGNRTKYEIFSKFGFVPSGTNILQRRKILKGRLDINSFYRDS